MPWRPQPALLSLFALLCLAALSLGATPARAVEFQLGSCAGSAVGPTLLLGWCRQGSVDAALHVGNLVSAHAAGDVRAIGVVALETRTEGTVHSFFQLALVNRVAGVKESKAFLAFGALGNDHRRLHGWQLSVLYNHAQHLTGWQLALILNRAGVVDGLQMNLGAALSWAWIAASLARTGSLDTWTSTAVPVLHLVGIGNAAGKLRGVQFAGLLNDADSAAGVQFGLFNRAGAIKGVQIGLINHATALSGVQLGLLNFSGTGWLQKLGAHRFIPSPLLNVGF